MRFTSSFTVMLVANFWTMFNYLIDYIPPYLQPETQLELRAVITKKVPESYKIPGYVYAWDVVGRYSSTRLWPKT